MGIETSCNWFPFKNHRSIIIQFLAAFELEMFYSLAVAAENWRAIALVIAPGIARVWGRGRWGISESYNTYKLKCKEL